MIIQGFYEKAKKIVVEGKIGDKKTIELYIDSGSVRNNIRRDEVSRLNFETEECKHVKTVFGEGNVNER